MRTFDSVSSETVSSPPHDVMPYRVRRRLAVPAFAAATLLAACGGSSEDTSTSQATSAPTTAATTTAAADATATTAAADGSTTTAAAAAETASGAEIREVLLSLPGEALDGAAFDNTAFVGEDVLLWFWAPW